jgi:aerobic carbon-monoxide dehydrogenase medium subunit
MMPASAEQRRATGREMKPAAFAYARARSLDHAIELLGGASGEARVLAGGQSLVAALNMRLASPDLLVDINAVAGLDRIAVRDGMLEIGALVRHAEAERSDLVARHAPLIALALPHIGHAAIRNRGTIGGSVAFADPAAELPACLVALAGEVSIAGPDGHRAVGAEQFFRGLFETALGPREVLTAIRVPVADRNNRFGFAEFCRRHGDYAMVGLAANARREDGRLRELRLVYFGVGAMPVRARRAEAVLTKDPAQLAAAMEALKSDLSPPDDVHASGAVKTHLAGVLLARVAHQIAAGPT